MKIAEKIKQLRKQAGMSQEKLAEKLGVSRQAVTKWETEKGMPDIENLISIAALFNVSLDDLLLYEAPVGKKTDFLYESVTEYDIDGKKRYDIQLGGVREANLSAYDGEKLRVRLVSDTLSTLQQDLKLKIDDNKSHIDLDIVRKNNLPERQTKEGLTAFVFLPAKYLGRLELSAHTENIRLRHMECEDIELDVKTPRLLLDNVCGRIEIDCNLDMQIICKTLSGAVELNQISAVSKILLPQNADFKVMLNGIGTRIYYRKDGLPCNDFSNFESKNTIGFNGIKSELFICKTNTDLLPE